MKRYKGYHEAQRRIEEKARQLSPGRLDLFYLELAEVPKELCQLTKLVELKLNRNQLTEVPKELGQLANLTELNLNDNLLNPELATAYEQGIASVKPYL